MIHLRFSPENENIIKLYTRFILLEDNACVKGEGYLVSQLEFLQLYGCNLKYTRIHVCIKHRFLKYLIREDELLVNVLNRVRKPDRLSSITELLILYNSALPRGKSCQTKTLSVCVH